MFASLALFGALAGPVDTSTVDYTVGGVHVIQHLRSTAPVVAVDLYLLGGTQQLTARTAGIELLALRAGQYGTNTSPVRAGARLWRTPAAKRSWRLPATGR